MMEVIDKVYCCGEAVGVTKEGSTFSGGEVDRENTILSDCSKALKCHDL